MALLLACLCTTISLTVLIVACLGGGTGGYTTRHGIRVHGARTLPREAVELATHAVLNEAREADPRYTPQRLKRIQYCSIEFVEEPFKCGYVPTGLCSGVYHPGECRMKVALKGDSCGDKTALVHEQVHMVNDLVEGKIVSHGSPKWFYGPDSVTEKANQTFWQYCEKDVD